MSTVLTPIGGFSHAPTLASLQFTVLRDIGGGQGQNSEVKLVHDHQLDTQLVMKQLAKARIPNPADYFSEARRLYDSRHRHVVDVKYACETPDAIHIAMPYYRGGSLESLLDRRHLMTREVVRYGLEFLSGVHHIHVRGLVHFDIKPTNVLLDDADTAAVADFGLSQEVVGLGLAAMTRVYLGHMPPELNISNIVTKSADIYQSGVTLYRMCVGNIEYRRQLALYHNDTDLAAAVASGSFPDRRRFLAHTPNRLRTVVKTALAVDTSARFGTILELMNALAQVDESLDWAYTEAGPYGAGTWYESNGSRSRRVELTQVGTGWNVQSTRISAAGRAARCGSLCVSGAAERDARRLVEKALSEAWH